MLGKRKKPKVSKVDSLIGKHSEVIGNIKFSGGLHVDGTVNGSVFAEGDDNSVLTVSERGTINGEVRVPYVVLNGVVIGDVYAHHHVELAPHARVEGDVHYTLIEMAMGAEVNGKLVRTSEAELANARLQEVSTDELPQPE